VTRTAENEPAASLLPHPSARAVRAVRRAHEAATAACAEALAVRGWGLDARLRALAAAHRLTGYLEGRLAPAPVRWLEAQGERIGVVVNPARAAPHRSAGASGSGSEPSCPLCDLPFAQLPLPLVLAGQRWRAALSPAPYTRALQYTLATRRHRPHRVGGEADLDRLLAAMAAFLDRAPGWLLGFNQDGAGPSVPQHRHVHALRRQPGDRLFSLARIRRRRGIWKGSGSAREVRAQARMWWRAWRAEAGEEATFNLVLMRGRGRFHLFFAPRRSTREMLAGLEPSRAGFLEAVLGVVVLKHPPHIEAFARGTLGADVLVCALRAVRPQGRTTRAGRLPVGAGPAFP